MTDTRKGDTFLYPDFYKLSLNDQMSILYHEAQWILNPKDNYKNIIDREFTFQAYLEDPTNINRAIDLAISENYAKVMELAINSDRDKQLYNEELKVFTFGEQRIPFTVRSLAGSDFMKCAMITQKPTQNNRDVFELEFKRCQALLLQHARKLHRDFPLSAFLYLWYKCASAFKISYYYDDIAIGEPDYSYEEVKNILMNKTLFLRLEETQSDKADLRIEERKEKSSLFGNGYRVLFFLLSNLK